MKYLNCSSSFSFAFLIAALPAISGCVFLGGAEASVTNGCSSDSDCEGGICADVFGETSCVAEKAELPGLILEVRPSAEAKFGSTKSFLMPFGGEGLVAQSSAGLVVEHDIGLSEVRVSPIELFVDYEYKSCALSPGGKFAADFTFYRHAIHGGLPEHEATAFPLPDTTDTYAVDLPQGAYDIHVVPRAPEGCTEPPPPPTFHRDVDLSQGGKIDLHLAAAPRHIAGTIGFPQGQDLTGWSIEVVEPKRGKLVSSTQVLSVEPLNLYATYSLEYYWEWGTESSPVLRLRPPDGVTAPKLFWEVASLSPLNPDEALIQADLALFDLDAVGRDVEAFVLDSNGKPVFATVDLKSTMLSGNASTSAHYNVLVDTDENGLFKTKLPPGTYKVTAHPTTDPMKAVTTVDWEINQAETGCFCGGSIKLLDKSVVSGSVILPNGIPLGAGTASVTPSRLPERPYLSTHLVADAAPSQIAATPLGPFGDFSLRTDPGFVDLTVIPPPGSLFPWVVRPQLHVKANQDGSQASDLPGLLLSYPVVVGGVVRDPAGAVVKNATVRAWMPVIASGSGPGSEETVVVQIAEGATDASGRFTLALTPSISK